MNVMECDIGAHGAIMGIKVMDGRISVPNPNAEIVAHRRDCAFAHPDTASEANDFHDAIVAYKYRMCRLEIANADSSLYEVKMTDMIKAGDYLVPMDTIHHVDLTDIMNDHVVIVADRQYDIWGVDAIELIMMLKPSALEGRRLKWRKGAWRFHNWIGHPGMDLLAMLGFKKAAIRWHDYTTPTPRNRSEKT